MIGRRGFFGAVAAIPAVIKQGIALGTNENVLGYGGYDVGYDGPSEVPHNPLREAYYKARTKAEMRMHQKTMNPQHMPPHIAEKRSWSTAFKQKVWADEQRAFHERWDFDITDPADMIRAIKSIGGKLP